MHILLAAAVPDLPGISDIIAGSGITVVGVLAFFVIGFIRGWIITPGRYEDMKATAEMWHKAYDSEHAANLANADVAKQSLSGIQTTVELLTQLKSRQTRARRPTSRGSS